MYNNDTHLGYSYSKAHQYLHMQLRHITQKSLKKYFFGGVHTHNTLHAKMFQFFSVWQELLKKTVRC